MSKTIEKMNDTLDAVRPYYIENFGSFSKKSSRSTRLKDGWYINYQTYLKDKRIKFEVILGYFWFWEEELPYVGVRIHIPTYGKNYKTNEYFRLFSKELKHWIRVFEAEEYDTAVVIGNYSYLSQFMMDSSNEDQLKSIIDFFKHDCIDELKIIKQKHPDIFTGIKKDKETELTLSRSRQARHNFSTYSLLDWLLVKK